MVELFLNFFHLLFKNIVKKNVKGPFWPLVFAQNHLHGEDFSDHCLLFEMQLHAPAVLTPHFPQCVSSRCFYHLRTCHRCCFLIFAYYLFRSVRTQASSGQSSAFLSPSFAALLPGA